MRAALSPHISLCTATAAGLANLAASAAYCPCRGDNGAPLPRPSVQLDAQHGGADPCRSSPCQNGGRCIEDVLHGYACLCGSGRAGHECQHWLPLPAQQRRRDDDAAIVSNGGVRSGVGTDLGNPTADLSPLSVGWPASALGARAAASAPSASSDGAVSGHILTPPLAAAVEVPAPTVASPSVRASVL
eukprot:SAG31_NODE_62_length_28678_cov_21.548270_2_plen_188_part_00